MQLSDITVRIFMRCLFNKDYEGVDNWEELYTAYIDLSGMGESRHLQLMVTIHNLQVRLSFIQGWLEFQKTWTKQFKEPFIEGFKDMEKFNHRVTWDPGKPLDFIEQLKRIEAKEKRNVAELDLQMKELDELMKTKKHKEKATDRADFIRMLNTLGKEGYKIDRDKTDMEELSLMIKQHSEEVELITSNPN